MKTFVSLCLLLSTSAFGAQVLKFSDLKKLSSATTAQFSFDEAINLSANFGTTQMDPDLKPYFGPTTGKSELCVPTTLANYLIYQMAITQKLPISDKVPGVSKDLTTIDANALIIELSKKCKTNYDTGTNSDNLMVCIGDVFNEYFGKKVAIKRIVKADKVTNPDYVTWENRQPDINDLREAMKKGLPVLGSVNWNIIDPVTKKWKYTSGHVFGIFGYSWEKYFENNLLQLQIMDPAYVWTVSTQTSVYNNVTAIRRRDEVDSSIFIDGRGFNGQTSRGWLGAATIIDFE
ncbi:MAG: hypothetical protein H7177_02660 [Rhizobacter sp.]|nr:hypothetical protein [Bacteriovorax sp.]